MSMSELIKLLRERAEDSGYHADFTAAADRIAELEASLADSNEALQVTGLMLAKAEAIPPEYALAPVEPTREWIDLMTEGSQTQCWATQSKVEASLRERYKKWIAMLAAGPTTAAPACEQMIYRCVIDIWMERGLITPTRERTRKTALYRANSRDEAMRVASESGWVFAPTGGRLIGVECVECSGFAFPYCLPDPAPVTNVVVSKTGNNRQKSKRGR